MLVVLNPKPITRASPPSIPAIGGHSHGKIGLNKRRTSTMICAAEEDGEIEVKADLCPGCGVELSEAPKNCDGDGHIASGVGAVIGFEWWPIKAYRPCPAFEAAGKTYVRKGQLTNEILFRRKDRTEF